MNAFRRTKPRDVFNLLARRHLVAIEPPAVEPPAPSEAAVGATAPVAAAESGVDELIETVITSPPLAMAAWELVHDRITDPVIEGAGAEVAAPVSWSPGPEVRVFHQPATTR